jgi:hypothetical protein
MDPGSPFLSALSYPAFSSIISEAKSTRNREVAIDTAVPISVVLLTTIGLVVWWRRKRLEQSANRIEEDDSNRYRNTTGEIGGSTHSSLLRARATQDEVIQTFS